MRARIAAIGLAAAGLVGGGVLALGPGAGEAAPTAYPTCSVLRVTALGGPSTLFRVDLASGAMTRVRTLDRRVDAIGYHRGQGLAYGVSGGNVVSLTPDGVLTDLGPVPQVRGASAGTVMGDLLVVRVGSVLRSVSIDPRSPRFLSVVASVRLRPAALPHAIDDFDVRDGLLYGVSARSRFFGHVVSIDPATGRMREVGTRMLPGGTTYGSAAIGPDGALYAAANRTHWTDHGPQRGRLIRVEPRRGAKPVQIANWPVADHTDMTGCAPARPIPPTTTTTTVPPTTPPTTTRPTTTRPTTPPPTTRPTVPPTTPPTLPPPNVPPPNVPPPTFPPTFPPPTFPPPAVTTSPQVIPVLPPLLPGAPPPGVVPPPGVPPRVPPPAPPPAPTIGRSSKQVEEMAEPGLTARDKMRRWGIATLVLILGAGAVAGAAHRRHR
ncbi:DUF6923 family protein [Actinokineospora sp. NPDC004072]